MQLSGLDVTVNIRLTNNAYQFDCKSATGKTRLYNVVKTYQYAGYNVAAYSYSDLVCGVNFNNILSKNNLELLIVDRYDMFSSMYHNELEELSKRCIILIDSKRLLPFGDYYLACSIKMTPTTIEVFE